MRLLCCTVGDRPFTTLEEFYSDIPDYAILSHRWGQPGQEISFKDLESGDDISQKRGYQKLKLSCEQAVKDGLKYIWIDTCCIDKSSSAELSEAINSMFEWYSKSTVCYAYLDDVTLETGVEDESSSFRSSKWWTRGWTLQELLAPSSVKFYDRSWNPIGTKSGLAEVVSNITTIHVEVLRGHFEALAHPISVAQKMSWAVHRKTTREEDRAYSLMGLFGVNMPLLYGEGARAIIRLQEEIMRTTYDHSLFAWRNGSDCRGLLATSIENFSGCGDIISVDYGTYEAQFSRFRDSNRGEIQKWMPNFSQTNYGTQIELPLQLHKMRGFCKAYLACTSMSQYPPNSQDGFCSVGLRNRPGAGTNTYERFDFPNDMLDSFDNLVIIKRIFVATLDPYVFGFKDMATRHMRDISFHTNIETEFKRAHLVSTSLREKSFFYKPQYYCHGLSQPKYVESQFVVSFAPIDNAFLALLLGSATLWSTKNEEGGVVKPTLRFMVFCGIHNGALWTDVSIDTKTDSAQEAYALYLPNTDLGRDARLAARSETRRTLREVFSPKIEELEPFVKHGIIETQYPVQNASLEIRVTRRRRTDAHWSCNAFVDFKWIR
ncbi:Heterokaryon incompatibility protein (HET) domain containing protein [Hyaloscypha variabilis]